MKLLFDHHLSPSLVRRLRDLFPGSEHVWNLGLDEAPLEQAPDRGILQLFSRDLR